MRRGEERGRGGGERKGGEREGGKEEGGGGVGGVRTPFIIPCDDPQYQ